MPADPMTPAGITWEKAMSNAGEILSELQGKSKKGGWAAGSAELWSSRSSYAQAWIAFARELTMHARAGQ
jgi:hypothetical protein